jgi:nitrogen fixation/metabolism regulation signal transduction histidine kinase
MAALPVASPTRRFSGLAPRLTLFAGLLLSLYFLAESTQDNSHISEFFIPLILLNIAALLGMFGLVGVSVWRLIQQYRHHVLGSRLTTRLVTLFTLIALAPVSIVYYVSMRFIEQGINSWFDVKVEHALDSALRLTQMSLDLRMRDFLRQAKEDAQTLREADRALMSVVLDDVMMQRGASEIALFGDGGRVVAWSSLDATAAIPTRPPEPVWLRLRQGEPFVALDTLNERGLNIRVVIPVPSNNPAQESWVMQQIYPMAERLGALGDEVKTAYQNYRSLAFSRKPLTRTFTASLSLIVLLSLLTAVWLAFYAAHRLVAPFRELAEGTRAVAAGDYSKQLQVVGHDELGILVGSFNDMTRRIAQARDQADRSQQQVESQRAYLEVVLGRLSSGVITLDADYNLRTCNPTAAHMLGVDLRAYVGERLDDIIINHPSLDPLGEVLSRHVTNKMEEWREQITLQATGNKKILMCRGSLLPGGWGPRGGAVVVFDDITALLQAQRDAAWGEVARRLAHEIKNPLTPIQLAAERVRHKVLDKLDAHDAQLVERSTHTIIQQVEAMKSMVNAFAEYARAPAIQLTSLALNDLINEVAELYRANDNQVEIRLDLDAALPPLHADAGRLRQLLHNLIKNALEALTGRNDACMVITTDHRPNGIELTVRDNGPGFPEALMDRVCEPYVSSKAKGTGLGLAIVKKIVEEHGGTLTAANRPEGGAMVYVRLPIAHE